MWPINFINNRALNVDVVTAVHLSFPSHPMEVGRPVVKAGGGGEATVPKAKLDPLLSYWAGPVTPTC